MRRGAAFQAAKEEAGGWDMRPIPGVSLEDSLHAPATGDEAFGLFRMSRFLA